MRITRTMVVSRPLEEAFAYLQDFTNTEEWDPGTVSTRRISGDGSVGTRYHNVSKFLGNKTELEYVVLDHSEPLRLQLRGENKSVVAEDTMTLRPVPGGTELTYQADFTFKRWLRWIAPLMSPALKRLGDGAERGLRRALG